MSNSLDPDQARHFVGPDLGPNLLHRLSADEKKWPPVGKQLDTDQRVDTAWPLAFGSNFYDLAKVLATTNSEPG